MIKIKMKKKIKIKYINDLNNYIEKDYKKYEREIKDSQILIREKIKK